MTLSRRLLFQRLMAAVALMAIGGKAHAQNVCIVGDVEGNELGEPATGNRVGGRCPAEEVFWMNGERG